MRPDWVTVAMEEAAGTVMETEMGATVERAEIVQAETGEQGAMAVMRLETEMGATAVMVGIAEVMEKAEKAETVEIAEEMGTVDTGAMAAAEATAARAATEDHPAAAVMVETEVMVDRAIPVTGETGEMGEPVTMVVMEGKVEKVETMTEKTATMASLPNPICSRNLLDSSRNYGSVKRVMLLEKESRCHAVIKS